MTGREGHSRGGRHGEKVTEWRGKMIPGMAEMLRGQGCLLRGHLGKEGVLLPSGQEDEVGVEKKFFQPQTPNTSLFKRK